jgi:hypothetical protein
MSPRLGAERLLPTGHRLLELLTSFAKEFDDLLWSHSRNFTGDLGSDVTHQFDGIEGFI